MKTPRKQKSSIKPRLTHVIYEGLREEITTGKLKPGVLLSRRDIASRYGSSYIPVIEAMVRLENAGLVDTESNQMARVRKISLETIQSDYVLREACETQAIRLACLSATPREIEELYRLAESIDAHAPVVNDPEEGPDREALLEHWQFHKNIAEISRYPVLVRELERIELLDRLQANWRYVEEIPYTPRSHSLLVDAIKAGDPEAADKEMRLHVHEGLGRELKAYRRQ